LHHLLTSPAPSQPALPETISLQPERSPRLKIWWRSDARLFGLLHGMRLSPWLGIDSIWMFLLRHGFEEPFLDSCVFQRVHQKPLNASLSQNFTRRTQDANSAVYQLGLPPSLPKNFQQLSGVIAV